MLTDLFIYFHSVFPVSFRSFVPPVRDEESETQRKAHAKRVRETRRSTQGVTLEEVKSAEQLAKKKQAETVSSFTLSPFFASSLKMMTLLIDGILLLCFGFCLSLSLSLSLGLKQSSTPSSDVDTAQLPPSSQQSPDSAKSELERRPSWRLCINDNNKNKVSIAF